MEDSSDKRLINWTVLARSLAILLGIMSAVALARNGFEITLNEYLDAVVRAYDDTLKDLALSYFEPLIRTVFEDLRSWFGWHLQLYPHWKHVFVLLWLLFGAAARAFGGANYVLQGLFYWIYGALCALAGGVMSGTSRLDGDALFWWSLLALLLYESGINLWHTRSLARALEISSLRTFMIQQLASLPFILLSLISLWLWAVLSSDGGLWPLRLPFQAIKGHGAALLAAFVGIYALIMLVFSLGIEVVRQRRGLKMAYPDPILASALDILAVLAVATFLVWLGHNFA